MEVLVVIGIIALLMALLLPALGSARRSSEKAAELNNLRMLGPGWTLYSEYSNNRVLPGYLPPSEQTAWNVSWTVKYDGSAIPAEDCAPYVWRLMPYLDHNHYLLHSYAHEEDDDPRDELGAIALEPAWGYNATYIGGWYEGINSSGVPIIRFEASNVIARTMNDVRSDMVLFASSAQRTAGLQYDTVQDNIKGTHSVAAPTFAQTPQWTGEGTTVTVMAATAAPIMRYTSQIAVLLGDGSTASEGAGGLFDQRRWIHIADRADFTHAP